MRRSAEGDASPVASPPKAEVESEATMIAKPSARLRRGEILLPHTKEMILKQIIIKTIAFQKAEVSRLRARPQPQSSRPKAARFG